MAQAYVTVYTTPTWGPCKQLKAWLSEQGVAFEAKDVIADSKALEEMMERARGVRGVPVTIIGDEVVSGFNKERIAALLGLA